MWNKAEDGHRHKCENRQLQLTSPSLSPLFAQSLQKEDKNSMALGYMASERAYRIVLVGDAAVGKSSFLLRLCKNEFKLNSGATVGQLDTPNY